MTKQVQDIADADLDQVTGAGDHTDWIPIQSVSQSLRQPGSAIEQHMGKVEIISWQIEEGE